MYSATTITTVLQERVLALTSGYWGDSTTLRNRTVRWYAAAGIPEALVRAGTLHPIVEYAANVAIDRLVAEVEMDGVLLDLPTVLVGTPPYSWQPTSSAADKLLEELLGVRMTGRHRLRDETPEDSAQCGHAVALLDEVCQELTRDALGYTRRHYYACSEDMVGRTWTDTGGLTITGAAGLETTAVLAESLFHEALHSKFYVLERGLAVPSPDSDDTPTPVRIPWQRWDDGTNHYWTIFRAVDAFYVYVHVALLRLALLARSGSVEDLERLRRVCFRSAYLASSITKLALESGLDDERWELFKWLDSCRLPEFDLNRAGQDVLSGNL